MIFKAALLLLVLLVTIYVYYSYGPKWSLLWVVFPALLCIPFTFELEITPGIPPITFFAASSLPLFLIVLYKEKIGFNFSAIDWVYIAFMVASGLVTLLADDLQYASWTLQDKLFNNLVPYFLIRILIDKGSVLRVLGAFGAIVTVLALFAPLEYFGNIRIVQLIQYIWPDWAMSGYFMRDGNYRVFSSFGHPIYAGIAFSIGLFIGFLTWRLKVYESKWIPWAMMGINTVALYMTVSRTSYILSVPILLFLFAPFVKRKGLYLGGLILSLVLVVAVALPLWNNYVASGSQEGADETATSAAYRAVLVDNYLSQVWASPLVGHGFWLPVMGSQASIDNYFLYLLLRYGIPTTVVFVLVFILLLGRGFFLYVRSTERRLQLILWPLLFILLYIAIVAYTVWFTQQVRAITSLLLALTATLVGSGRARLVPISEAKRWL